MWRCALPAILSLAACGGRDAEPLDGGLPIEFTTDAEDEALMAQQYCARREKGGWHRSVGHCEAMDDSRMMTGVWVTAFEENSFFPNAQTIPHPLDPRRYSHELEMDTERVRRLAGKKAFSPHGEAYLLSFTGRRMRDPYMVDCSGIPQFATVVDRLHDARHLGALQPVSMEEFKRDLRSRPVTVKRRHGGRWGELEAEAEKRCAPRVREQ